MIINDLVEGANMPVMSQKEYDRLGWKESSVDIAAAPDQHAKKMKV